MHHCTCTRVDRPTSAPAASAVLLLVLPLVLVASATSIQAEVTPLLETDVHRGAPDGSGPHLGNIDTELARVPERAPTPRVETYLDLPATLFAPGKADPQVWMATGTWARVTYDGFNYDFGYDPLAQSYDMMVSGYAVSGGIIVQESVGVMAVPTPASIQSGQVERVECWFRVSSHNLYPDEWVGITALEDDYEPSSSLNSLESRLLYEDARGFRGVAYVVDHFDAGPHALDLGAVAVQHFEQALVGKRWFGVGFGADGWDLSGSLGVQVFWRVAGGGALPESTRPFFRVVYNAPPSGFVIQGPANGETILGSRPTLRWSAATDPNGDAPITYRVTLSLNPDFSDGFGFDVVDVTQTVTPLALEPGAYYWKVDATDPFGAKRIGPSSSFVMVDGTPAPPAVAVASARISCSPNPFNPRTEIRLEVPRPGPARVDVVDARGRVVRRVLEDPLPGGTHRLMWDGTDAHGAPCASGVYEVIARVGEETVRTRITLVR